jgi:hypothetical protein
LWGGEGKYSDVLAVLPATEHLPHVSLDRLVYEYGLRPKLDDTWTMRQLEFVRQAPPRDPKHVLRARFLSKVRRL